MSGTDPVLPALWELETAYFGESEIEKSVRESIAAINAKKPIDRAKLSLCQTAVELARNIAAGNRKGRAIANEAMALQNILDTIAADPETENGDLPDELKELLNGFASAPRLDPAPASHGTELG